MRLFNSAFSVLAAALVFGLTSQVMAESAVGVANGRLKTVTGSTLVVTDKNDKDRTYQLANNAVICCPESKDATLTDLKPGDRVSILWDRKGEEYEARAILQREGHYTKTGLAQGKVQKVENDQIVIADEKGKDWTYVMGESPRVRLKNKDAKISSFKSGDDVVFVYAKKGEGYELLSICDCFKK